MFTLFLSGPGQPPELHNKGKPPLRKFLILTATYLAANAVGLLAASDLLPGFRIDVLSFVMAA